ncbi:hypothetical protein QO010_000231 [Caulobacter ginsengisoli]|uniref:Uncharacterized protein n=1 Tax=Caulobacter ginsengisoli TaxID=400775 RepID=A0ABU0IKE9_9CAUL|nr:hypothetical protein [Caulobacter ginsengisoli]MDQ0462483.1 hypothetical protein [Caulobacter ginsengisoli]
MRNLPIQSAPVQRSRSHRGGQGGQHGVAASSIFIPFTPFADVGASFEFIGPSPFASVEASFGFFTIPFADAAAD